MSTDVLSIGQVAERTGLSVHTLRFYEREGLFVRPVRRAAGGRRLYTEDDADWLMVCIVLRASGMPLPAIRRYTELVRDGAGNETERLALLRRHQEDVLAQKARLDECLDLIHYKIGIYEDILDGMRPGRATGDPDPAGRDGGGSASAGDEGHTVGSARRDEGVRETRAAVGAGPVQATERPGASDGDRAGDGRRADGAVTDGAKTAHAGNGAGAPAPAGG